MRGLLSFGALSPHLADQLTREGYGFIPDTVDQFQQDLDAICRLRWRSILTPAQAQNAYGRVGKQITKHIEDVERPQP